MSGVDESKDAFFGSFWGECRWKAMHAINQSKFMKTIMQEI